MKTQYDSAIRSQGIEILDQPVCQDAMRIRWAWYSHAATANRLTQWKHPHAAKYAAWAQAAQKDLADHLATCQRCQDAYGPVTLATSL